MSTRETVIARREGRIGRLILNRPRALNALDLAMIEKLHANLVAWRDDPGIHAVVIEGAGGRAFCVGGDVRTMREHALAGDGKAVRAFFAAEYALNGMIAGYPKPYVALIDGLCMGGGVGVSVHGAYRVATEAAVVAMPETAIGLFPDVGTTYVLPRLPGKLGIYLALTGARMEAADAVHAGFATHYVRRARLTELLAALVADGVAVLADFAEPLPAFSFGPVRGAIDRCFGAGSVTEILARLKTAGTTWACETLAELKRMSPSSVMWSFAMLRAGARRTLDQCLAAELAFVQRVVRTHDFQEGVRAMLVDKDRAPCWRPEAIEAVDEVMIAEMLAA